MYYKLIFTVLTLLPSLIARRWVGLQTQWRPRHKAIYFSWLGPELFFFFFFVCCLAHRDSTVGFLLLQCSSGVVRDRGISRCPSQHVFSVESSSLFHHSIYLWFICLPWWSIDGLENLHADRTTVCFEQWQKLRARLGSRNTGLSPAPLPSILIPRRYFYCVSLLLLVLAVRIYTRAVREVCGIWSLNVQISI